MECMVFLFSSYKASFIAEHIKSLSHQVLSAFDCHLVARRVFSCWQLKLDITLIQVHIFHLCNIRGENEYKGHDWEKMNEEYRIWVTTKLHICRIWSSVPFKQQTLINTFFCKLAEIIVAYFILVSTFPPRKSFCFCEISHSYTPT